MLWSDRQCCDAPERSKSRDCAPAYRREIAAQALQCEPERLDRAFQPLEQVDGHQRLQALFTVGLPKLATAARHLGVVQLFVLLQPARQDVVDRRIDGELQQ